MNDFDDVRDSLRADGGNSGFPFWVAVVIVVVIGALGGLLSNAITHKPQPAFSHISANLDRPVITTVPASTGLPEPERAESNDVDDEMIKHMAKYSKDELFAKRSKLLTRYKKTISQARSCGEFTGRDQIHQIIANYEAKNIQNYEAWLDGRNKSKFEAKMESGDVSQSDVMRAALTGELRRSAADSTMENMAMMNGMMSSSLTPNQCSKLRADMQMGDLDIPPPPSK